MIITKQMLQNWSACDDGIKWFCDHFNENGAEYQEILDKLADENLSDYATWLLDKAGAKDTVIELDEINSENSFFSAGTVKVTGGINVKFHLIAGGGVEAGLGIKAGWGITAGEYGVFAGLSVKVAEWNTYAIVSAKNKPANLISGYFLPK